MTYRGQEGRRVRGSPSVGVAVIGSIGIELGWIEWVGLDGKLGLILILIGFYYDDGI